MCSLLIWGRRDNVSKLQWQQFARGDVIDLQDDDDFHWGNAILGPDSIGWWRAAVVPGVPAKSLQGLVMGDAATVPAGKPYRMRTCRIDLDALEEAEEKSSGRKLDHYDILVLTYADLSASISEKLVKADGSVFGLAPTVIG